MGEKNSMVYLFGFSPNFGDKLDSLFKILKEQTERRIDINIVLIHDGIIGVTKKGKTPKVLLDLLKQRLKIYAMIPDIIARGMDSKNLLDQVKGIGYDELVDLLVESRKIVSWM